MAFVLAVAVTVGLAVAVTVGLAGAVTVEMTGSVTIEMTGAVTLESTFPSSFAVGEESDMSQLSMTVRSALMHSEQR